MQSAINQTQQRGEVFSVSLNLAVSSLYFYFNSTAQ